MQIIVDSSDTPEHIRLVLPAIMELAGIPLGDDATIIPGGPALPPEPAPQDPNKVFPPAPPVNTAAPPPPPPPPPPAPSVAGAPGAASVSEAPPHTFPTSGATAAGTATAGNAAAPPVANQAPATSHSDEVDSAGLPWDGRIHQARKGKKKDGTWKIVKGADPATVAAVVAELAARKLSPTVTGAAAPASSTVPVPPGQNSLPLPPAPPAPPMPVGNTGAAPPIPAPPAPPVGSVPASGYRELIKKASAANAAGKIDAAKLQAIVQKHGAANLQALRDMPDKIPEVDADLDAILLGAA